MTLFRQVYHGSVTTIYGVGKTALPQSRRSELSCINITSGAKELLYLVHEKKILHVSLSPYRSIWISDTSVRGLLRDHILKICRC